VLQVFDENRLTRDDFLGMVELPLISTPKEAESRVIPPKRHTLQPRSTRSKVKGYLQIYAAFIPDPTEHVRRSETTNGNVNESPVNTELVERLRISRINSVDTPAPVPTAAEHT